MDGAKGFLDKSAPARDIRNSSGRYVIARVRAEIGA